MWESSVNRIFDFHTKEPQLYKWKNLNFTSMSILHFNCTRVQCLSFVLAESNVCTFRKIYSICRKLENSVRKYRMSTLLFRGWTLEEAASPRCNAEGGAKEMTHCRNNGELVLNSSGDFIWLCRDHIRSSGRFPLEWEKRNVRHSKKCCSEQTILIRISRLP